MRIDWNGLAALHGRRRKVAAGVAALLVVVLAAADVGEAQRRGGPGGRGPGFGRARLGPPAALLPPLRQLDLSDEQSEEVRSAVAESREAGRETARALRDARRALAAATAGEEPDEDGIRSLAADIGRLEGDAAVERAQLYAAVWRMLTPEQQARATELRAERAERRTERRERLRERLEERLQDLGR